MYSCKICAYRSTKNLSTCPVCGSTNSFADEDMSILEQLGCNSLAIYQMQKLKKQDIIEYELKMSQFITQYEQQQSLKQPQARKSEQSTNHPKCPTCGSTNIEKISVGKKLGGGFLFGIFSSDVRNTMHCRDCGAKW